MGNCINLSTSNYIFLPGYIKASSSRQEGRKGGGVALLIQVSSSRQEGRKGGGVALLIKHNFYFTIFDNYKTSSFESIFSESNK